MGFYEKKQKQILVQINRVLKQIEIEILSISKYSFGAEFIGEEDTEKFNLMKVEWLPRPLSKLSDITGLNLSENRIMALPTTISGLRALTKLDVHSNQLINLSDSIGKLVNLADQKSPCKQVKVTAGFFWEPDQPHQPRFELKPIHPFARKYWESNKLEKIECGYNRVMLVTVGAEIGFESAKSSS